MVGVTPDLAVLSIPWLSVAAAIDRVLTECRIDVWEYAGSDEASRYYVLHDTATTVIYTPSRHRTCPYLPVPARTCPYLPARTCPHLPRAAHVYLSCIPASTMSGSLTLPRVRPPKAA